MAQPVGYSPGEGRTLKIKRIRVDHCYEIEPVGVRDTSHVVALDHVPGGATVPRAGHADQTRAVVGYVRDVAPWSANAQLGDGAAIELIFVTHAFLFLALSRISRCQVCPR